MIPSYAEFRDKRLRRTAAPAADTAPRGKIRHDGGRPGRVAQDQPQRRAPASWRAGRCRLCREEFASAEGRSSRLRLAADRAWHPSLSEAVCNVFRIADRRHERETRQRRPGGSHARPGKNAGRAKPASRAGQDAGTTGRRGRAHHARTRIPVARCSPTPVTTCHSSMRATASITISPASTGRSANSISPCSEPCSMPRSSTWSAWCVAAMHAASVCRSGSTTEQVPMPDFGTASRINYGASKPVSRRDSTCNP